MGEVRFPRQKIPSKTAVAYRKAVKRYPFALFGLPFILMVVSGSFMLTPTAAMRYEQHDKKRKWMDKDDKLANSGVTRRKVDMREEYYKLAAKDLDDWEQRRVKRLPGEPDGILE